MSEPVSGGWTGIYFYPDDHPHNLDDLWPPTPFVADLTEQTGVIGGWIREPARTLGGAPRQAEVAGSRTGDAIAFTKTPTDGASSIEYAGVITHEGRRIEGQWHIIGSWSGHFRMDRSGPTPPAERLAVRKTVGAGQERDGS